MNAIEARNLRFSYGSEEALKGISFSVPNGALYALVGPNGSGKSTVFKLLSSLYPSPEGALCVSGVDWSRAKPVDKKKVGTIFQSPALDVKLTVAENLKCHGYLYGISGSELNRRLERVQKLFGLKEIWQTRVEKLSGGWRRRVELGKIFIPQPEILLLDEATTGLDVIARREFWDSIQKLRKETGLTVLFTSHLLEETETATYVAFLVGGKIVAQGNPSELRLGMGGDIIAIRASNPSEIQKEIEEKFSLKTNLVGDEIRIEKERAHEFIPQLVSAFSTAIQSVTLGRPTLEDVFIKKTGRKMEIT